MMCRSIFRRKLTMLTHSTGPVQLRAATSLVLPSATGIVSRHTCLLRRPSQHALPAKRLLHKRAIAQASAAAEAPSSTEQFSNRHQANEGSHSEDFFGHMCGQHTLQADQLEVFHEFSRVMRQCSTAFFCVAASNIALTCLQARGRMLHEPIVLLAGVTIGNFAFWADSLLVAVLLHYGATSFSRLTEAPGSADMNHLPLIFQGISRLALVFQQFGVAAMAVAVVHTLEAASKEPSITKFAAGLFFFIAGLRSAALWWLMSRHSSVEGGGVPEMLERLRQGPKSGVPRWERMAMSLLVGHLLAYNMPNLSLKPANAPGNGSKIREQQGGASSSTHSVANGGPAQKGSSAGNNSRREDEEVEGAESNEYEFTGGESQMLRILMDSMHTAGLALIVQGLATGLLGVANFMTGNHGGAASMGYNGFSKAFTAAVLFRASAAFDRAVTSPSRNIESMMSAIGDKGLTKLLHQLTLFSWTVAISQVLALLLPVLKTSPVANIVSAQLLGPMGQFVTAAQNLLAGI